MSRTVSQWLEQLELSQYSDLFSENEIGWDLLPDLDHEILTSIGISIAGHRMKIIRAAKALSSFSDETLSPSAGSTTAISDPPTVAPEVIRAERRQLTVMFCDLVGSTALSESIDPEIYRSILTEYRASIATEIKHYDGYIAKHMGDGLLIYFGYPQAHEDDAERAVRAGLAIIGAVNQLTSVDNSPLQVRIGISTGLVVAGDIIDEGASEKRSVLGDTPNLAARLQGMAEPDTVIVSDSTRVLLNEMFELQSLGSLKLKGFTTPIAAFSVDSVRIIETRFSAARSAEGGEFVGRQQELALLRDKWDQAKGGEGQLVVLSGEAGIGKSRIASALTRSLESEDHLRISYQCSPYHTDSALYPTIQQLTFASGFNADDSPDMKLDKLETLLSQGQKDISLATPLLGALLGIGEVAEARYGVLEYSPQQRREQTLQILVEQLIGVARHRPVIFIVEDAHWIDPTTQALIELTLDQIDDQRVMLLVTARPTFSYDFGGHPIVSKLSLNRLGRDQVISIIDRITAGKSLPAELITEITTKTDGVPLFVEELTKTILDSGQLQETDTGFMLSGPVDRLTVPNSLHDSLMARLDRMQAVKEVAQTAACIGREFSFSLLEAICSAMSIDLKGALKQLVDAEIVFKRGGLTDPAYIFKHALVRDAAYGSLLKSTRLKIHERILSELVKLGDTAPEILAHHASEADEHTVALKYWQQAGDQATDQPAFDEAISHFNRALQCLKVLESNAESQKDELDLLVKLSNAATARYGYSHPKTVDAKAAARGMLDSIAETPHRMPLLYGSWVTNHVISDHAAALNDADSMCIEAERSGDRIQKLIAYRIRGSSHEMMGNFQAADNDFSTSFELNNPTTDSKLAWKYGSDPGVSVRICWAISLLCRGEAAQALELIADIEDSAKELGHINAYAYTLFHLSWFKEFGRLPDRERLISESIEVSEKYGLKMWHAYSYIHLGALLHDEGKFLESVEQMAHGLMLTKQSHVSLMVPYHHAVYASSLAAIERYDEAANAEENVIKIVDKTSEKIAEPEIYRLFAISHYRQLGDNEKAIAELNHAKSIATQQDAILWDLRISVSLSHIYSKIGEKSHALKILKSAIEKFPIGGHDLPDMKSANTLLHKLMLD